MGTALEKVKCNVKQGWKTSVLGIILFVAALVSVFVIDVITWWPDATIAIVLSILLILAPDTLITTVQRIFKDKARTYVGGQEQSYAPYNPYGSRLDESDYR